MGWDTALLYPPCPAFAQGSAERHGENRKNIVVIIVPKTVVTVTVGKKDINFR